MQETMKIECSSKPHFPVYTVQQEEERFPLGAVTASYSCLKPMRSHYRLKLLLSSEDLLFKSTFPNFLFSTYKRMLSLLCSLDLPMAYRVLV